MGRYENPGVFTTPTDDSEVLVMLVLVPRGGVPDPVG